MTQDELRAELALLIGEPIVFTRLAINAIIVYFCGEPGDETVRSTWLDPPWRYERDRRVVLGSNDLYLERDDPDPEKERETEWRRRCNIIHQLDTAALESIDVDEVSADLVMRFSGDQVLRQFSSSGLEGDANWIYRNHPKQLTVEVSPARIEVLPQ